MQQQNQGKETSGNTRIFKIILPIIAIVAILTTAAILFGPYISHAVKKMTMSPEEYCKYILRENIAESQVATGLYDTYFYQRLQSGKDVSYSGEWALELSGDAVDLLEDKARFDAAEAFRDLKLGYEAQRKGEQVALETTLRSGKKDILSSEMIYDGEEDILYGIIPLINEDYAKIDLDAMLDDKEMEQAEMLFGSMERMADVFPEPKEVQDLQERYCNLIIDEIDDVEERSEKLTIEDVTQSVTVLTVRIEDEQVRDMIISWYEEAGEDDTLKQIVTGLAETDTVAGRETDPEKVWENWVVALDKYKQNAENMELHGEEFQLELYVSKAGKIQGMDFTVTEKDNDDPTVRVYFAYAINGNRIAMEGNCVNGYSYYDDETTVSGKGSLTGGKLDADFDVESGDDDLEFRVENVDIAGIQQGHIAGDLILWLKQFKSELANVGLRDLKDQTLTVSLDVTDKSNRFEIRLAEGNEIFAAITLNSKTGNAGSVKIPANSECIDISDEDEMEEYIAECDTEELKEILEDFGLADILGDTTATMNSNMNYINASRISADTMLADNIHMAVLLSMIDPEITYLQDYEEDLNALMTPVDITAYTGDENVILWGARDILGEKDLHDLSDRLVSTGATGRIWVTVTGPNTVSVVLEGTDNGSGQEIRVD